MSKRDKLRINPKAWQRQDLLHGDWGASCSHGAGARKPRSRTVILQTKKEKTLIPIESIQFHKKELEQPIYQKSVYNQTL
jgi:hypothetical protein